MKDTKFIKIAVSGSANAEACSHDAPKLAEKVGEEIAKHNCILITGATTGIPHFAAKGCKKAGGVAVGFSPAASEREHKKTYKLPTEYHDVIVYTGFHYAGRNLLMTRSADAIIFICGRMGTLNEFTIAFEDQKPIGVLENTGGISNDLRYLVKKVRKMGRYHPKIIFEKNPKKIVEKLIEYVKKKKR